MTRRPITAQQNDDGPLDQEFEKLVNETMELWHVPGVAVAVIDGENTWAKGYGIASFPSTPVTPSTLFYAGSTTKAFTAAIMSFLVDDNDKYPQVQWDTPINQLLRDDFVLENVYATNHTTIEDALSHRSGLPRHDYSSGGAGATVQSVVRNLRYLPISAEPRTKYQYCNTMFVVASHVIETVTGKKLGDLMREWIWKPLEMNSTFFDLDSAKNAKEYLAHGYKYLYHTDEGGFEDVDWMALDGVSGAGSVITNVLDYAKWARTILNKSTPLSKNGFEACFTPRTLMPFDQPFTGPRLYALGWRIGVLHGQRFYTHSGGMLGFGAELLIFPDIGFAVVALANTTGTSNLLGQKLTFRLVDEKLKVPLEKRFDWNKRNQAFILKGQYKSLNAAEVLYPHHPSPKRPLSLPLALYVGTYHHPAYKDLTIYLDKPKPSDSLSSSDTSSPILRANRLEMSIPQTLIFEHVSGEFFVARSKCLDDFGALYDDVYPVEFRIGSDGRVREVGVGWEQEMGERKIWFRRVEGSGGKAEEKSN